MARLLVLIRIMKTARKFGRLDSLMIERPPSLTGGALKRGGAGW